MDMAYSIDPHLPKVRMRAVRLVKHQGWSMRKAARYTGVEPSTVKRWCDKDVSRGWKPIPTCSSRPHHHPHALPVEIVRAIVEERLKQKRCAEVVHEGLRLHGISVSFSSVKRTLDRTGLLRKRSPWKRPHDHTPRPDVNNAGDIVQIDTIHLTGPMGERIYAYTLIDLHSRWAYAKVVRRISAGASVRFVREAQKRSPFQFRMVQSDHGSEFSTWFTHAVWRMEMKHRHTRVRQSNDNAHVERFNRTIQEECLGAYLDNRQSDKHIQAKLNKYLEFYNYKRIHLSLQYKTPSQMLQSS